MYNRTNWFAIRIASITPHISHSHSEPEAHFDDKRDHHRYREIELSPISMGHDRTWVISVCSTFPVSLCICWFTWKSITLQIYLHSLSISRVFYGCAQILEISDFYGENVYEMNIEYIEGDHFPDKVHVQGIEIIFCLKCVLWLPSKPRFDPFSLSRALSLIFCLCICIHWIWPYLFSLNLWFILDCASISGCYVQQYIVKMSKNLL